MSLLGRQQEALEFIENQLGKQFEAPFLQEIHELLQNFDLSEPPERVLPGVTTFEK